MPEYKQISLKIDYMDFLTCLSSFQASAAVSNTAGVSGRGCGYVYKK